MIPSAVVVPDDPTWPPSPSLKRRQSSLSSDSSKRPRLDTAQVHPGHRSPPDSREAESTPAQRRKLSALGSSAAEEKKRGQRLFGALLGNLSQTAAKPAHRRRDEIEKRQQDKLRQKDEELVEEKRKKREQIDVDRREEQKVWDEQSMRTRHTNMQATAHFLRTQTEPRLYFRPWELRPEEEEVIRTQLNEIDETIKRELAEHAAKKGAETGMNEVPLPVSKPDPANTKDHEQPEQMEEDKSEIKTELVGADTDTNLQHDQLDDQPDHHDTVMTNEEAEKPDTKGKDVKLLSNNTRQQDEEKSADDHGGEELVEGQEDDVIY